MPVDALDDLLRRQVVGVGILSHLRSFGATMSQKSSLPQAAKSVSQVLKPDTLAANQRMTVQSRKTPVPPDLQRNRHPRPTTTRRPPQFLRPQQPTTIPHRRNFPTPALSSHALTCNLLASKAFSCSTTGERSLTCSG